MKDFPENYLGYYADLYNKYIIGADTNHPSPYWCCGMTVAMAVIPVTPLDQFITIGTDNDIRTCIKKPKDGYYSLGIQYGSPLIQAKDIVFEKIYSDSVKNNVHPHTRRQV